jgi:hypothetical protein
MDKQQLEAIVNDQSGIYTSDQKTKATQALAEYEAPRLGDGFTTLTGSHSVCLGSTFETRHFQIVVESGYGEELLRTRTMNQAANQAANDRILGSLQAKYDDDFAAYVDAGRTSNTQPAATHKAKGLDHRRVPAVPQQGCFHKSQEPLNHK